MVEYLIELLSPKYHLSTLSRGYKRKTSGFRLANDKDDAQTLGDEPFQFYLKYSDKIRVAVGEERALAIPEILFRDEEVKVIILDDAYQHRAVAPDLNILLSDYNRPFFKDYVLPAGMLRESRKNAQRADIVVVTKCPEDLPEREQQAICARISKYTAENAPVFFTRVQYLEPVSIGDHEDFTQNVFLFTGIASGLRLEEYIRRRFNLLGVKHFSDHYFFNEKDLEKQVLKPFLQIEQKDKSIVTTEKDAVRIKSMKNLLRKFQDIPFFYVPIKTCFLKDGGLFDDLVLRKADDGITN